MANRLNGKVAVVTGAASGMGKAIAIAYLKEGAKVMGADINEARLLEVEKEVAELGLSDNYGWVKCNITSTEDCNNAVKACVDKFGTMNVLSHNAGISDNLTPAAMIEDDEWDRVMAINATGTMKICRAALQYFVPNEIKASMVLITSNTAFESVTAGPAYCASKCAANGYMKGVAYEYGRKGIRCNSICPGPVATNISESMTRFIPEAKELHSSTGYNAHYHEWAVMPTGGVAEDVAPLSVYLASDESLFVNSASIIIDGGVCLGGV